MVFTGSFQQISPLLSMLDRLALTLTGGNIVQ